MNAERVVYELMANYISSARIILALSLALVEPLGLWFYAIYILCGFSDVIDGYIARKTNTSSTLGAKLDSIADFVMVVVLIIVLYPLINLTNLIITWIAVIGMIKVSSMGVVYLKFKTFGILHTYGNKLTGLLLFAFPFTLAISQSSVPIYIICGFATISAVEELIIHLKSKELYLNRKSIFIE